MNKFFVFKQPPKSCDTFAVQPPGTSGGTIVFGKNSDRPDDEVQEVIYQPAQDYLPNSKLKCTYIEIEQVPHTYAVVLSKPSWMWGAEMGANEFGVAIGNEAVWTTLNNDSDSDKKLLGMDLLRLALERGKTAVEALHIIVSLIENYGMGGNCSDTLSDFTYHNSFLIADPTEVWILECAGIVWAAEKVTDTVRNISNELSIRTKIDLRSSNIEDFSRSKRCGKSMSNFDFKKEYSYGRSGRDSSRFIAGKRLLSDFSRNGLFTETDMFKVLRDEPSGICMSRPGSFMTTASQVSVLRKLELGQASCHWFTATPNPMQSVFKPFIFAERVTFPCAVVSPMSTSGRSDRRHELYKKREEFLFSHGEQRPPGDWMEKLESKYTQLANDIALNYEKKKDEAGSLFDSAVANECTMYTTNL